MFGSNLTILFLYFCQSVVSHSPFRGYSTLLELC